MKVERIDSPPQTIRRRTAPGDTRTGIESDDAVVFEPDDDSQQGSEQQQQQDSGGPDLRRDHGAPQQPLSDMRGAIEVTTVPEVEAPIEDSETPAPAEPTEKKGLNVIV